MKIFAVAVICAFALSFVAGQISVPLLKRIKAGQPILKFVKTHASKSGTPTMGGLFFLISAAAVFFTFGGGGGRIATVILAIAAFYMLVGFLDDLLKIKLKHNEGLKPYQKIVFQAAIAALGGVFVYVNGLDVLYLPFVKKNVEIGWFAVPLTAFLYIAVTNSVNLTDGLDGLAGGVSVGYISAIFALIVAENAFGNGFLTGEESDKILLLCAVTVGATCGFLMFNVSKARVFMGDTGSLGLGGIICGVSAFTGNALFIPIIGAAFVWSSLSVIMQVIYFKRTRRRIFFMSPYHHHLQMKGYTEAQIGYYYSAFTVIMGLVAVIFYI